MTESNEAATMTEKALPLAGTRIIAVEQYGAGPFGSMLLADLGAEVIKVENPADGGDVGRVIGPHFFSDGDSHFFQAFNRNKQSITINLKDAEGKKLFHRLVASADAVMDNMRGDQPERLGVDYASLKDVNPKIVCAHLSAYGRTGPRKSWPGYDYLMQAEAGYLAVTGEPGGPPARFGLSIVDMMTGLMSAFALSSALNGARRTGIGCDIDTSLFDTALHNLNYLAVWYLNAGHNQSRDPRSAHPSLTPSQLYRTADGWIFIMCNKEKFWRPLVSKIGKPEWGDDPRFCDFEARLENRALLTDLFDEVFLTKTTAQWLELLSGEVPVAPVNDIESALENPYVRQSDLIGSFERENGEAPFEMLASPLKVDGRPLPRKAAPSLGAHTDLLLEELGYDEKEVVSLRSRGII
ncbi:CoA transferase [Roseovarius sp. A46]|uniref:CaiB/BaiF CoA transferase family protein n=1 Tax=Roseovarius sp. A46 TaxID=2109331 RepID=UPI00101125FE|nr:CoA transferase [Roseovarius sp. A46]RXV59858.1 CoA transferase [Roseovarius sp. A46]